MAALLAAGAGAENPPPAPAPPTADAKEPATAPPPSAPATIPSDLERLAEALPGEHRTITAGDESFDVFVRGITGGPAKGALVLIPGDGGLPPTSDGLAALRDDLPAHGWSTWLISVPRPPRVQAITEAPVTAAEPAPQDDGKVPVETAEQAPAAKATETESTAKPAQEADFPELPASAGLDSKITARMQDWIAASTPRIAAAVQEAAKEGPVTLVAEGAAATLLTGFVASGTTDIAAVILIDPIEVQGADTRWPDAFPVPVLEVLDAESRADMGRERRTRANAARLANYRQLTLPGGYQTEEGQPSVLARRIRGWLLTLPEQKQPPATPEKPAAPGPEALGPNRS